MTNTEYINFQINQMKLNGHQVENISDGNYTFKELYTQRMELFLILCNLNPGLAWKSRKYISDDIDTEYFLAGIMTEQGNLSYDVEMKYWDEFNIPELKYSSNEKIKKLY